MSMDFNAVIDNIMPLVYEGNDILPLIISRKDGRWEISYFTPAPEKLPEYLASVRKTDPYAVVFKGSDFAKASFPAVYDRVLAMRLRAEYETTMSEVSNPDELHALVNFLEENMGELSFEATEYIVQFDKPLEQLFRMIPESLSISSPGEHYDTDAAWAAFEIIGDRLDLLIKRSKGRAEVAAPPKRMIDGYEEKHAIQLAGRLVIFAENPQAEEPYLVCYAKWDNPLGLTEYHDIQYAGDFVEAMWVFNNYHAALLTELSAERAEHGRLPQPLTADHCIQGGLEESLEGKLIVIDSKSLSPEYRSSIHQLQVCTGGFGAKRNSRGNAVYCKDLYTGEEQRFQRYNVLGVANHDRLPEWAKVKLNELQSETKKPSLLGRLDDNKQKVERDKAESKDKPAKNRSGNLEV